MGSVLQILNSRQELGSLASSTSIISKQMQNSFKLLSEWEKQLKF